MYKRQPSTLPIWMEVVGCAFAIIIVKQLFGGLGQNFMNPALAARCFLLLAYTRPMTDFVIAVSYTHLDVYKRQTVNIYGDLPIYLFVMPVDVYGYIYINGDYIMDKKDNYKMCIRDRYSNLYTLIIDK